MILIGTQSPRNAQEKNAISMIACVSSFGLHMYYFSGYERLWKTVVIRFRPSRKGSSVKWHSNGITLASSADNPAQVAISRYCPNQINFVCRWAHTFKQERITSLAWASRGQYLIAAGKKIEFFQFISDTDPLQYLGSLKCTGFPPHSRIVLQAHPSTDYFFACAPEAHEILVWGKATDGDSPTGWEILQSVHSGYDLHSLAFSSIHDGLIAAKKGSWKFFGFNKFSVNSLLKFHTELTGEHGTAIGKCRKNRSDLVSIASSNIGNYLASGGSGDTLLMHKSEKKGGHIQWKCVGTRKSNVCYGEVKCVKFNPKVNPMMRMATGGSGFIHIWAAFMKSTSKVSFLTPERKEEPFYYQGGDPDDVNVPSSDLEFSCSEEIVEGPDEVTVEYVEGGVEDEDADKALVDGGSEEEQLHQNQPENRMEWVENEGERERKRVEGGTRLSVWFEDISKEAKSILDQMNSTDDLPKAQVKSLCGKILDAKVW